MAKALTDLKRRDRKAVENCLAKLEFKLIQNKYGFKGELHWPLAQSCSCKPASEMIVSLEIITRTETVGGELYKAGDYSFAGKAGACSVIWTCDLELEASRTFMDEAQWMLMEKVWACVSAMEPNVAAVAMPTRDEVFGAMYGSWPVHA